MSYLITIALTRLGKKKKSGVQIISKFFLIKRVQTRTGKLLMTFPLGGNCTFHGRAYWTPWESECDSNKTIFSKTLIEFAVLSCS